MILPETKAVYRIYVAFHCCVENAKRKDEDKCRTTEHKNSQMNTEQQDAISPSLQRNNRPNNLLFCEHGLFALNNFGFIVHQYNSILILCAPLDGLADAAVVTSDVPKINNVVSDIHCIKQEDSDDSDTDTTTAESIPLKMCPE
ncbi:hypothetical protein Tsp_13052 [Trichinella spiralis]|uniref:hypothetical protein n=1 Tax=Trichinella spiralis TaxID=6334 RepID=UPI0001EFDC67|nr:hypothetical protein Tsp_13052 [Trichinella spiralis]